MKGLVYKDLLAVVKHYRTYFVMCLIFMAASWVDPENLFYTLYPCILIGTILVSLIALDESSKWDMTCGFLPFTQEQLVGAKYLLGLMMAFSIFLISVGGQVVRMLIQDVLVIEDVMMLAMLVISTGLVMPGIMLPFIYKFGVEKGRLAYLLTLGGSAGLLAYFGTNGMMVEILPEIPMGLVALVAVGVYGVSCLISIRICKKKVH